MRIDFIKVNPIEVKTYFPEFYAPQKDFFEINKNYKPIGFFGIKTVSNKIGEISVYFNEQDRKEITKSVAIACLKFPFTLGFSKVLISTELQKMKRFLKKMTKFGVKYLTEHNNMHWFEMENQDTSKYEVTNEF